MTNLKMSAKILGAITLVLFITSGFSFWIMQNRINRQAEESFRDKLHQMLEAWRDKYPSVRTTRGPIAIVPD